MGRKGKNKRKRNTSSANTTTTSTNHNTNGTTSNNKKTSWKNKKTKRQKRERFWIEDCTELSLPNNKDLTNEYTRIGDDTDTQQQQQPRLSLEILITRSELIDDYRQVPKKSMANSTSVIDKEIKNDESAACNMLNGQDLVHQWGSENSKMDKTIVHYQNVENLSVDIKKGNENIDTLKEGQEGKICLLESTPENNDDNTNDFLNNPNGNQEIESPSLINNNNFEKPFISVKRANSAKKPINVIGESIIDFEPLANGDCGDGIVNPYPTDEVPDKFWSQRRRLFTLFDQGIQLDKESWYSVTPEAIANHIAAHLVSNRKKVTILDPFCGCGGNSIAFARRLEVELVVCVDTDRNKLEKAMVNASIYGISKDKMIFIHEDASKVLKCYQKGNLIVQHGRHDVKIVQGTDGNSFTIGGAQLLPTKLDCVFLSPPWGGANYANIGKRNYTLKCIKVTNEQEGKMSEVDGEDILRYAVNAVGGQGPIAYFLPRNINGVALGQSALKVGYDGPLVMEQNVLNGKLKTVTAYFGL